MKLFVMSAVVLLLTACQCNIDDACLRNANWKQDGFGSQAKNVAIYQCDKETRNWAMFRECMHANGWYIQQL